MTEASIKDGQDLMDVRLSPQLCTVWDAFEEDICGAAAYHCHCHWPRLRLGRNTIHCHGPYERVKVLNMRMFEIHWKYRNFQAFLLIGILEALLANKQIFEKDILKKKKTVRASFRALESS